MPYDTSSCVTLLPSHKFDSDGRSDVMIDRGLLLSHAVPIVVEMSASHVDLQVLMTNV